jgi:hypothetical protein
MIVKPKELRSAHVRYDWINVRYGWQLERVIMTFIIIAGDDVMY